MKIFKYIFSPVLISFALTVLNGCEKEIQFNLSDYAPKIVMNGILSPDSLIEINVSKSFLYADTTKDKSLLKGATLTLSINGKERETMQVTGIDTVYGNDTYGNYTTYSTRFRSTIRPKQGDLVRIDASAQGFTTAYTETIIPQPPEINQIDTTIFFTSKRIINTGSSYYNYPYSRYAENISEEEFYRNMRIKMAITGSPSAGKQYYLLRVRIMTEKIEEYPDIPSYYLYLFTNEDPVFDESYQNTILEDIISEGVSVQGRKHFDSALFSNKLFSSNHYTLNFSIYGYYYVYNTYEKNEDTEDAGWGYYPTYYVPVKTEVFNPPLEVVFTIISPELYPFYRKANEPDNMDEDPFQIITEPETTISNVHNGIGIVGAVSSTKAQVNIAPFPGGENKVPRY